VQIALIISILLLIICLSAVAAACRWRKLGAGETRVLLSGGGTGGHVNPALAIAEGIRAREPNARFLYVGVKDKAESVIVVRAGYRLRFVVSEGFPGFRVSLRFFRFLAKLLLGIAKSVPILIAFAPKRVVATGGYVSAPVIFAAIILKWLRIADVRIFLHEQNSIPGQLNALMGKWVDRVLLTFPQTLSFFPNGVVVGYPIRNSIVPVPLEEARKNIPFDIPPDRDVVFVFGGSQGSRAINRAIVDALPHLLPHRDRIFIIHGTGLSGSAEYNASTDTDLRLDESLSKAERSLVDEFYHRQDYFHNIADIYSVSSLIVCRSGAGSLNEISRIGKPALLIPKANLPGDHQVMNARAMKSAGAADVLYEDTVMENGLVLEKLDGTALAEKIMALLGNPSRLREMADRSRHFLKRKAIERIIREVYQETASIEGNGYQTIPFKDLASNSRLLQMLTAAYNRSALDFDPVAVVGDLDDLEYYRHRAAGLLSHKSWQSRNLGVKLIGFTRYREAIPTLLEMLSDKSPVNWFKKMLGGDFEQVGFIRRNVVHTLQVLDHFDPEVESHLLFALADNYFEVRAQACRTAAYFGGFLKGSQAWLDALRDRLFDPCFEVVCEAAKAVGEVGKDLRAASALLALKESHYWQVRNAALHGLKRLIDRGVLEPSPDLLAQMSGFILTSTDFKPHFAIKETYAAIQERCRETNESPVHGLSVPARKISRKSK
jgi:UDP-N-acetylglucosamine--N-acetylmuramyl-(pentapeptide) pyrophosphoryl-undecaprenol N-acetylglucosamine transferase